MRQSGCLVRDVGTPEDLLPKRRPALCTHSPQSASRQSAATSSVKRPVTVTYCACAMSFVCMYVCAYDLVCMCVCVLCYEDIIHFVQRFCLISTLQVYCPREGLYFALVQKNKGELSCKRPSPELTPTTTMIGHIQTSHRGVLHHMHS